MSKSLQPSDSSALTKDSIIGLGEASVRKNYFPALQKKIADLEQLNSKYKALIETIPDVLLTCSGGEISVFSPQSGDSIQVVQEMLVNPEISELLRASAEDARRDNRLVTRTLCYDTDNRPVYFEARINVTGPAEALIIIRDMTCEIQSQEKMRELALQDGLTKLYNRRYFEDALFEYSGRVCDSLSIILMDIDGLKIINDTLGHISGDQILISIAEILKSIFTQAVCVARVGGDEFGVLLSGSVQGKIELQLKKLDAAIKDYNHKHVPLSLSVSFGYSHIENDIADISIMYREADNKMYQNKLLKERSNRNSIVKTLMKTLEAKDFITEGHAQRMEKLAERMGLALLLPQDRMDRLSLLAKFHDIGKVGIPDSILMKEGKLNDSEWEIMKSHSSIGKRIAEVSSELRDIAELILYHHERWDGAGYPLGLREDDIPVECRILSIVDTFDAMTNDRPYRKALPHETAIKEILRCSGTQFDRQLVELFASIADTAPSSAAVSL
jgi:diguanylate cyclase (GGDEF)-like protein